MPPAPAEHAHPSGPGDRTPSPRRAADPAGPAGSGALRAPWLLVSDLDDTLLGDDDALARFAACLRRADPILLAFNSSRPLASVRRTLATAAVRLVPDALVGAMGTELEVGGMRRAEWTAHFDGWDRAPVDRLMARMGLPPHRDEFQTSLKASFTVPRERWGEVGRELDQLGVAAHLVGSGTSDLDILPPGAGKGPATQLVARILGVPVERLIVAGDSANDLEMFAVAPHGIVVGNAREELKDDDAATGAYRARSPRADGVLEGLWRLGLLGGTGAAGDASSDAPGAVPEGSP